MKIDVLEHDSHGDFEKLFGYFAELFDTCKRENVLESIFENSVWVRVPAFSKNYVVGKLERGGERVLCFGLPVFSSQHRPKELGKEAIFVPLSKNFIEGFGYYIVFRNRAEIESREVAW